jgi:cellulose synthase/poly-beta-1,6-N-acetylglucosamine synthase-like glycosyltransferase
VQEPPTFDLVVGTVGRVEELARLLDSLERQTHPAQRIVVVDQSGGTDIGALVGRRTTLPLIRLEAEPGLSRARNAGLRHVTADVVAFPDDDCVYPDDLLERAARFLRERPAVDVLTGRTADRDGRASPRWHPAGVVRVEDVWHAGNSAAMFVRRRVLDEIGPFDERLGLGAGTPWTSTEDVELLVRALLAGARVEHDPTLVVEHALRDPDPDALAALGRRDGGSVGFVLGLHRLGARVDARMFTRPLGGAALAFARGDTARARFHLATWRGRVRGYRAGRRARSTSSAKSAA